MIYAAGKSAQRAAGKAARRALSTEQRREYSKAVCLALQTDERVLTAKTVLAYVALPTEADCAAICAFLEEKGLAVAYPRCLAEGQMEAYMPLHQHAFTPDIYGIASPDPAHSRLVPPEELDVVLVPLTAFDADCGRVGMGAGIYDRYLPRCKNAAFIGLAFSVQQVEKAHCEATDTRLHAVFTEKGRFEACN